MDLITKAITGALSRLDEDDIKQLYNKLKGSIQQGYDTGLVSVFENLEQNPESKDHLENFRDELVVSGARKDKILLARARELVDTLYPPHDDTEMGSEGTYLPGNQGGPFRIKQPEDDDDELVIGTG
jgi:hypothetical protein